MVPGLMEKCPWGSWYQLWSLTYLIWHPMYSCGYRVYCAYLAVLRCVLFDSWTFYHRHRIVLSVNNLFNFLFDNINQTNTFGPLIITYRLWTIIGFNDQCGQQLHVSKVVPFVGYRKTNTKNNQTSIYCYYFHYKGVWW